jgi:hypothetical protein
MNNQTEAHEIVLQFSSFSPLDDPCCYTIVGCLDQSLDRILTQRERFQDDWMRKQNLVRLFRNHQNYSPSETHGEKLVRLAVKLISKYFCFEGRALYMFNERLERPW